jgi:mRNA interferase RelE/StbE
MSAGNRPGPYAIELTRAAERALAALPKKDLLLVDRKIRQLADEPHPPGSAKIQGQEGLYRVRAGDYRIVYQVEDDRRIVLVVIIGNRKDIYRGL